MAVDKIDVTGDPRVQRCTAVLNGKTYGYLLGVPQKGYQHTVFLIHGWPDLSMGWRYQIPKLLELGFRVVAPDMIGYGRTDAPRVPPEPISLYAYQRSADDIAELARQLGCTQIILGGHDWGGAIVYRTYLHHPTLISHLFVACTPYLPPTRTHIPRTELINTHLPNFRYQLQLASPIVESTITTPTHLRQFFTAMYGGCGPQGERGFNTTDGLILPTLPTLIQPPPLMSNAELEYYVQEYSRTGLHGPLNWYRTYEANLEDDLVLLEKMDNLKIQIPVLFIAASSDVALPLKMAEKMGQFVPDLTRREVQASHWVLTERPGEVNGFLEEWFKGRGLVVEKEGGKSSL
ncbi:MAG: hypothetical protein M1834_000748 [Cirrosporium novae-zelandiae]|nr:MAG: hypothetical protein M1834_000748 [Cirrosporium novae-zelandiae]